MSSHKWNDLDVNRVKGFVRTSARQEVGDRNGAGRNRETRPHIPRCARCGLVMDPRWRRLGDLLVNWSTEVKPGEKVMISMGEVETFPLVRGVYEAVLRQAASRRCSFSQRAFATSC